MKRVFFAVLLAFSLFSAVMADPKIIYDDGSGNRTVFVPESATQPVPPPIQTGPKERPKLGANLTSPNDWTPPQFADAMKSARKPGSVDKPYDETAPVDDLGWPTQDAGFRVLTENKEFGDYSLFWEGTASVSARGGTVKNVVVDGLKGSATVTVNSKVLELMFKNTQGGVRNVELYFPGHKRGEVFHQKLLKACESADGFRLMDWGQTNNNLCVDYDQYPTTQRATWRAGIPHPVMWQFSRATSKPVWVCVPAMANNDFIRKFRDSIPADIPRPTVEYSNETWNGQFKQNSQIKAMAAARVASGDDFIDMGAAVNETYRAYRFTVDRTIEIKQLLGDKADVVLCTQVNTGTPGEVLKRQLEYATLRYGPPSRWIKAGAGAPYLSPGKTSTGQWYTAGVVSPQEIATRLSERYDYGWSPGAQACKQLCDQYGLKWYHYEDGGPDLQQFANQVPEKIQSQYLPETGQAMEKYWHHIYDHGAVWCNQFVLMSTYSKNGYWGLCQDYSEWETAPKATAFRNTSAWVRTLPER